MMHIRRFVLLFLLILLGALVSTLFLEFVVYASPLDEPPVIRTIGVLPYYPLCCHDPTPQDAPDPGLLEPVGATTETARPASEDTGTVR